MFIQVYSFMSNFDKKKKFHPVNRYFVYFCVSCTFCTFLRPKISDKYINIRSLIISHGESYSPNIDENLSLKNVEFDTLIYFYTL